MTSWCTEEKVGPGKEMEMPGGWEKQALCSRSSGFDGKSAQRQESKENEER